MKLTLVILISITLMLRCKTGEENSTSSPSYSIEKVCDLPGEVHESSGIIFYNGFLWTINDSGNDPILFGIDTTDAVIKYRLRLDNTINTDWEALTQDEDYIYIADNGNNFNEREKYQLYLIAKDSIEWVSDQTIQPQQVTYSFKNSDLADIGLSYKTIDSEAIIVSSDSFFVYIKDHEFNNLWVFSFPLIIGDSVVGKPQGQYASGYAITAATIVTKGQVAFLGYKAYHSYFSLLNNNPGLDKTSVGLFSTELIELEGTQTEGLTYVDGKFFISTESSNIPQSLFRVQLR